MDRRGGPYVSQRVFGGNNFPDENDYQRLCHDIETGIEHNVRPLLAAEGSSGTYFMRDPQANIVAVFKPKDEEPFAPLNPKWPKFFQRICCPCCFGRSCLLTNHGYLAEVGASLVDDRLGLNLVPKTRIVWLSSPSFNYPKRDQRFLPAKIGSLQIFMRGCEHAGVWLKRWESEPLDDDNKHRLLVLFQKMVILDYIIRNTDRSAENWLIYFDDQNSLQVAVIDNGLAFPVKHPVEESWLRPFPFYWSALELAKEPFVQEVKDLLEPHLNNPHFVIQLCRDLKRLFQIDQAFNHIIFEGQMRVLRGQIANVREVLHKGESPYQLAQMPPLLASNRHVGGHKAGADWNTYFKIRNVEEASCCTVM